MKRRGFFGCALSLFGLGPLLEPFAAEREAAFELPSGGWLSASITGGRITSIRVTHSGAGYTAEPRWAFQLLNAVEA